MMHDVFATGTDIPIQMMGHEVMVRYRWEGDAQPVLLAKITSPDPQFAEGKPIFVRRWIDPTTGDLHAESTCNGVTWLRRYEKVPVPPPPPPQQQPVD